MIQLELTDRRLQLIRDAVEFMYDHVQSREVATELADLFTDLPLTESIQLFQSEESTHA